MSEFNQSKLTADQLQKQIDAITSASNMFPHADYAKREIEAVRNGHVQDFLLESAIDSVLEDIKKEVGRAKKLHVGNFHNQHEAYAVILEELDELWDEIKKKQSDYDLKAQRKEATQCAAMLVRLITELT